MTNPQQGDDLTHWLLSDMIGTTKALGYTPQRFIKMVHDHGGVDACKRLLRPEIPASHGFRRLHRLNKVDWTVEAIATSSQWSHYFTEQEKETARFRLATADAICADPKLCGD